MTKKISILVAVGLINLGMWLLVRPWALAPTFALSDWSIWLKPAIGLVIFAAVAALAFLLLQETLWRLGTIILVGIISFAFTGVSSRSFIGMVILLVAYFIASLRIQDELHARTTVHGGAIVRRGLTFILFPIFIFMSLAYYQTSGVQNIRETREVPPSIIMSIKNMAATVFAPGLYHLAPGERAQVEQEFIRRLTDQLNTLLGPYFRYVPSALAIGLFLILQGLSFLFFWLVLLLAPVLFWILKKTNFVSIQEHDVKAEILTL